MSTEALQPQAEAAKPVGVILTSLLSRYEEEVSLMLYLLSEVRPSTRRARPDCC